MPQIIDRVAGDKCGICYTFYAYYTKMNNVPNVKMLNINNISVKSEDYPLLYDVYLIYRSKDNYKLKNIINFVNSEEVKNYIDSIK